jgi:hypothetical protein
VSFVWVETPKTSPSVKTVGQSFNVVLLVRFEINLLEILNRVISRSLTNLHEISSIVRRTAAAGDERDRQHRNRCGHNPVPNRSNVPTNHLENSSI